MIKTKTATSFHSSHGTKVELLDNGTVAFRVRGFDNGIVFTKDPIPIGVIFEVKIIEQSKWNGATVSLLSKLWHLNHLLWYRALV